MAQDILVTQDSEGIFDISIESGDIKGADGLDTAIAISLFTDARAPTNLVPTIHKQRGWVGNLVSVVTGRQLGGLLWLVNQRRLIQSTVNNCVTYARDSLQWMLDDNVLKRLTVTGEIVPTEGILLTIVTTALSGITETRYYKLWEVTGVN
jgi:phage gp46-like protein